MKLRRESAEIGDFSGPNGEFKKAPLSALAVAGFMKYAGEHAHWIDSCQASPTSPGIGISFMVQ
jgi:hypothetical protein